MDEILKLLRALSIRLDNIERKLDSATERMFALDQKMTRVAFSLGGNAKGEAPKGEKRFKECQLCGVRTMYDDIMMKSQSVAGSPVTYEVCKKCFYQNKD